MAVIRWIVDGKVMERNPATCEVLPTKQVAYRVTVDGREIRIVPYRNPVRKTIRVTYPAVDVNLRNFWHDLYVSDKAFWIQTNVLDPRDKWKVKIDEFEAPYRGRSGERQLFDVRMTLKVIDDPNDPILTFHVTRSPQPFVIVNQTNTASIPTVFIRASNTIVNPKLTMYLTNLIRNAGFEDFVDGQAVGWQHDQSAWKSDIIYYRRGARCICAVAPLSDLSQDVFVRENSPFTIIVHAFQLTPQTDGLRISVHFFDSVGNQVGSTITQSFTTSDNWQEYRVTDYVPTGAERARLSIAKLAGDDLFIDDVMFTLQSGVSVSFVETEPRTIQYIGQLETGDVLKIDTSSLAAEKNATENVSPLIQGDPFLVPVGTSILVFEDDPTSSHSATLVVRYEEWHV